MVRTARMPRARYDIVLIDGERRFDCAACAAAFRQPCVILDNSDCELHAAAYLAAHYGLEIPFCGFAPGTGLQRTHAYFNPL